MSLVDQSEAFSAAELRDRWARRGHDLLLHDPEGPAECLVRRGELVAPADAAGAVADRLRRWVDEVRHDAALSVAMFRLRPAEQDRCVDIAREHDGVAANHVHLGSAQMFGAPVIWGTGSEVEDAPPVPAPPDVPWRRRITVGVLDTGLDPHPWFRSRPWFESVPEVLDADDDSGQDRQAGHGTFVSGVVLQHAPGAVIRSRRVLSPLGFTDDVTVAAGLRSLLDERPDVVVLTAGCHTPDDVCPPVLRAEVERFGAAVVVAAAGNHSLSRPFWPAALPSVIAVAATGGDGALADFSNSGPWVDAAAPGVDVVSSYVRLRPKGVRTYGFARWSGTSFAAPRVAAAAAVALDAGCTAASARQEARRRYPFGR
ncbi:S8 family peptidase [Saccharopolyspora erythraea]|uniref:S8 family peptidase n=1 Tax=Saccharopolyspora erythraea TaxID=1836 RepID=UPI0003246FC5|nr:S8/S53 family peptidase [Saccharopolyspora erythraea]